MAMFTDKQLAAIVVVGGIGAYWLYRQSSAAVKKTVGDSIWWWGNKADTAQGEISSFFTWDRFDRKHRHKNHLMTDAQYLNWKNAVLSGQLPEPEYN